MHLIDLTHTSHTRARTGIQRVARSLHSALGSETMGITWDPFAGSWRTLEPWETASLHDPAPAAHRSAHWPWSARLLGRWRRFTSKAPHLPTSAGLIVPEVFSPAVAAALPVLRSSARGPWVAVFHDAIPLKFPELSPTGTVGRFPAYLQELLAFDGIAAVSADSRDCLLDYWRWLGVGHHPPVLAIPLGLDRTLKFPDTSESETPPIVLCVGSIEGRKNHLALLEAAEQLWSGGRTFRLHLVGLVNRQTGLAALERIKALQSAGRPLVYSGVVDDNALHRAYAASVFTVYPSLIEGFGLPVLESLAHGKPCICSGSGALGESARDGGCLALDQVNGPTLAAAMDRLLTDAVARSDLAAAASGRTFRSWSDYAADLTAWMATLPPR